MKFPTLSRSKATPQTNEPSSTPAPLASSQNTSSSEIEKAKKEKDVIETTPIQEAAALEKMSDEPVYPTGAKLSIIVASLCLSVFLMALDNTIIATAIPKITDQFQALDDVGWYGSGISTILLLLQCRADVSSSLSAHHLCFPIVLRQVVHFLQHQMGLSFRHIYL